MGLFTKLFGTYSDRELKKINPIADAIEKLEPEYAAMSDEQLRAKTDEFKQRLEAGETLDDILPEAFATAREAAWRVLGMKPFRVQLIGGIVLHQGRIAEMKTGEGKTLVAVLPAYLNALTGRGVHIVTVNDYLARRDSEWMGKVHRFLGVSVGLIVHGLSSQERRAAYACDITYGTNNEMGFDYLRDNMALYKASMVQRGHVFAIVDEVDSILIDEARTPLIISGQGDESTDLYRQADDFVSRLKKVVYASVDEKQEESEDLDADYVVDEKARTATLTARGIQRAERAFNLENLADIENATLSHHINQALKAHGIMKRDIDYIVKDGEIIIVDEFTGRLMLGRRYSEGLHQAIEAKEHVDVQKENKTLATITFQNYFRLYEKLSGMTGTAVTEAEEFGTIYKLDIIEIPTNKPVIRKDHPDVVYKNDAGKNRAIIEQIVECHRKGQPVLVGTVSIEKSEYLSKLLKMRGIPHTVLNAKYHEKEAEIVAQAGKLGAVTIATNMAGRGTDIMLGGNAEFLARQDLRRADFADEVIAEATGYAETKDEDILAARALYAQKLQEHKAEISAEAEQVKAAGGLFILGTERHESRRIDNQLRGRAGRQGDPGASRFYLSLEDDLLRLFASDRVTKSMDKLGMEEDEPIEHKLITNSIEHAQKKVEARNFDIRKHVLEYDDVMNQQREVIYGERKKILKGENLRENIMGMVKHIIKAEMNQYANEKLYPEEWTLDGLIEDAEKIYAPAGRLKKEELVELSRDELKETLEGLAEECYEQRELLFGEENMRELEKVVMLRVVDQKWKEHLDHMDMLREGINLRAYGQRNPLVEYKIEALDMFEEMEGSIMDQIASLMYHVSIVMPQPQAEEADEEAQARAAEAQKAQMQRTIEAERSKLTDSLKEAQAAHGDDVSAAEARKKPVTNKDGSKVGRNDPCPCGSGKKYKNCCGKNA